MSPYVNAFSLLTLGVTLPVLGTVMVILRICIRLGQKSGIGWDDWFIIPSLLSVIASGAIMVYGSRISYFDSDNGRDFFELDQKVEFAMFFLNVSALGFAKLSIVCFYRRIFNTGTSKRFDTLTKTLIGIIAAWTIIFSLVVLFQCGVPVSGIWSDTASCLFYPALYGGYVSSDALIDTVLFVLPLPLIAKLKLSRVRRLAIMLVFCAGALTVVASLVRVGYIGDVYSGTFNGFSTNGENGYYGSDFEYSGLLGVYDYWSMFEAGLAVIVACLPPLQVLFRKGFIGALFRDMQGLFSLHTISERRSQESDHCNINDTKKSNIVTSDKALPHDIERAAPALLPSQERVWDVGLQDILIPYRSSSLWPRLIEAESSQAQERTGV